MTNSKHSAIPWKVTKLEVGNALYAITPQGSNAEDVAEIYGQNKAEAKANAEFIVRAVNSYETLVDLLKRFIDPIGNDCPTDKEVKEALNQAEGK